MSELISSIGNFFQGPGGSALQAGATGAGVVGNLLSSIQRGQELNRLKQQQALATNPAYVSSLVSKETAPLNANLVQAVSNAVQANQASRGLAEAPGLFTQALGSALAPAQQANQNTALQAVLQQLGLPDYYGQTILGGTPNYASMAPAIAALFKTLGTFPGSSSSGAAPTGAMLPGSNPNYLSLLQQYNPNVPVPSGPDYTGASLTPDYGALLANSGAA